MNNMITLLLAAWGLTLGILIVWLVKYQIQERRKKKDNRNRSMIKKPMTTLMPKRA